MSRSFGLSLVLLAFSAALQADDAALWKEYGLVRSSTSQQGPLTITAYEMKDPTGALAAWEWQRSPQAKNCDAAPFCSQDASRTLVFDYNYLLVFTGGKPAKAQVDAFFKLIPNRRDSSLPAILTFIPRDGLVPASSRYILGPVSLAAFAPELAAFKPGFESGAEAQVAAYHVGKGSDPKHLVVFYYPTPEMARAHSTALKSEIGSHVKRSSVLVAAVPGNVSDSDADTLLSRIEYEAKVTWNETPPPSPIKPLYKLLLNIVYLSIGLSALALLAGLMYAGMRVYRRTHGTLDADEAMTTLHLTGD